VGANDKSGGRIDSTPANSRRHWRDIAIMLGVVAAIIAILFSDFIAAEWHARDAEREIIDLESKIPDNATIERVAQAFAPATTSI
jgi:hypothetical protein